MNKFTAEIPDLVRFFTLLGYVVDNASSNVITIDDGESIGYLVSSITSPSGGEMLLRWTAVKWEDNDKYTATDMTGDGILSLLEHAASR